MKWNVYDNAEWVIKKIKDCDPCPALILVEHPGKQRIILRKVKQPGTMIKPTLAEVSVVVAETEVEDPDDAGIVQIVACF